MASNTQAWWANVGKYVNNIQNVSDNDHKAWHDSTEPVMEIEAYDNVWQSRSDQATVSFNGAFVTMQLWWLVMGLSVHVI